AMRRAVTISLGLLTLWLAGCAGHDPHNRQAVSGKVTSKKQPLDQGTIQFLPTAEGQPSMGLALITHGEYRLPAPQGLEPGSYRVVISSGDRVEKAEAAPGESGPPAQERIPPEYNRDSTRTVQVTAGGDNRFDFDIP